MLHIFGDNLDTINIELTNRCNMTCVMCYRNNLKSPLEDIEYEKLIRIIDNIASIKDRISYVYFHWRGEPTLVESLPTCIDVAKNRFPRAKSILFTNGSSLNMPLSEKILNSCLDEICFSIDSINEKKYFEIRGFDFNIVFKNIQDFVSLKKKMNSNIEIKVNTVVLDDNIIELEEILSRFEALGIKVNFRQDSRSYDMGELRQKGCPWLGKTLFIGVDGRISPCCMDVNQDLSLGNIYIQDIRKILDNVLIEQIFKSTQSGVGLLEPCKNCFSKGGDYYEENC